MLAFALAPSLDERASRNTRLAARGTHTIVARPLSPQSLAPPPLQPGHAPHEPGPRNPKPAPGNREDHRSARQASLRQRNAAHHDHLLRHAKGPAPCDQARDRATEGTLWQMPCYCMTARVLRLPGAGRARQHAAHYEQQRGGGGGHKLQSVWPGDGAVGHGDDPVWICGRIHGWRDGAHLHAGPVVRSRDGIISHPGPARPRRHVPPMLRAIR
jgi:hypothetical protein